MTQDIRWIQRFDNFTKALSQLQRAHQLANERDLSELETLGYIQAFKFTHELAWNVLKDYIEFEGGQKLIGSKDTTREAFQKQLIQDGETWMQMIRSRNLTSHTYNQAVAKDIVDSISEFYVQEFKLFAQKMNSLKV